MRHTLLLTGGSGGIGQAIAHRFESSGYLVVKPDRQLLDLESEASIHLYMNALSTPISAFIHCAGYNIPKKIESIESTELRKTMQINAMSFYQILQHLIPSCQNKVTQYILGISSIYGSISRPGRFSYSASKFALHGMVKTAALELGKYQVKVNTLAPGFVDTRLTRQNNSESKIKELEKKIALGHLASPKQIAEIAFFLCSEQNQFITGQQIVADGGYTIGGFEEL